MRCIETPIDLVSLGPLFEKLANAKLTGSLGLHFEGGRISSAELKHPLPFLELGRELPTIEVEEESTLQGYHGKGPTQKSY